MNYNNMEKSKDIVQKIHVDQSNARQKRECERRKSNELRQTYELNQKLEMMRKIEMQWKTKIQAQTEMQGKIEMQSQYGMQQKTEVQIQPESQQKIEIRQESEPQKKVDEKKKDEFQTLVKKHENEDTQPSVPNQWVQKTLMTPVMNGRINEDKKQIQNKLMECSKTIRDIQSVIKETYQFKPCRQLCEVLVNIRQNVYTKIEDVQEDLEYVLEGFGIEEFAPQLGDVFEAKYHDQVYSNAQDARGKEIERVYSSGFRMDGDVIMKAQVSVKQ